MIRRPPRSTLFPYTDALPISSMFSVLWIHSRFVFTPWPVPKFLTDSLGFGMPSQRTRSEEHTSELQSPCNLVCRLLLEKKNHIIPRQPLARFQAPAQQPAAQS